jgi:hypothetical protein
LGTIAVEYRDIEYTVVQGIGRHMRRKAAAVAKAEKTIDRALAIKRCGSSLPHRPIDNGGEDALQTAVPWP